jgi:hypothetical protein
MHVQQDRKLKETDEQQKGPNNAAVPNAIFAVIDKDGKQKYLNV